MGSTSTPQQGFMSTPAFKIFERGLTTQTIQKFRGLNAYSPITRVSPETATDLLNVIVNSKGMISKMRLPISISANAGFNSGPYSFWDFQQGIGTRQVLAHFGSAIGYYTNDLANFTLIENNNLNVLPWSFCEANNILFGANGNRMQKWTGTNWQQWGIVAPPNAAQFLGTVAGNITTLVGYSWAYAYMNSVTGHVSSVSPLVAQQTGAVADKAFQVSAMASPDPQVDTIIWFRTLDGGGDYFQLAVINLTSGTSSNPTVTPIAGNGLTIQDNTPDANLNQLVRAPLINNPPPQGKYVALSQGRIFVAGIIGAESDVAYSGYEQILIGRPEESFPPNNLLTLSLGAEEVVGLGVLHSGIVMFSSTGKLWMLRGTVEDITLAAPASFSDTLEEMPWTLGCLSHFSIQSTPLGLVWLAGDKTAQFWDGRSNPVDISGDVYPILRTITPGTELQCTGAYFNWLEREWYALSCCTNGSATPNIIIFWSLDPSAQNIDIFVSNLSASWIGQISTSKLQRELLISTQGSINVLPVQATDRSGLTNDFVTYPPTNGQLQAYWRSGYYGSDQPQQSKIFRWTRVIPDRGADAYQIIARYVDAVNTIDAPYIQGPMTLKKNRTALNRRAFRCSIEIDFPAIDAPMNILELQTTFLTTSER